MNANLLYQLRQFGYNNITETYEVQDIIQDLEQSGQFAQAIALHEAL